MLPLVTLLLVAQLDAEVTPPPLLDAQLDAGVTAPPMEEASNELASVDAGVDARRAERFDPPAAETDADSSGGPRYDGVSAGPTGALYIQLGLNNREQPSVTSGGLGLQGGVRIFFDAYRFFSVSILGAAALTGQGVELALPIRAELIGRDYKKLIPGIRFGLEARPFTSFGTTSVNGTRSYGLRGTRLSMNLGWCLFVVNGLGHLGGGGGDLASALAMALLLSPDLTAGIELAVDDAGVPRTGYHLGIGIGF